MPIDRHSPIPFYIQVTETLRKDIREGKLKPGDQLPGEFELCQDFNVSRTVIRQALNELTQEGLIVREKGRGTFIAQPKIKEQLFQKLTGFYQDMVEQGYRPVTRVLRQGVVGATLQIGHHLQIEMNTPVIEIERLRFVDNEPIAYVITYLPYQRCPDLLKIDLTDKSLYAVLEESFGIFIARGARSIEAVGATKREAELLNTRRGAPLIKLESISFDSDDHPVEYYQAWHLGERSRFEVELVRVRAEAKGIELPPPALGRLRSGTLIVPRQSTDTT